MSKSCLKQVLTWLLSGVPLGKFLGFLWDTVLCPPPTKKKLRFVIFGWDDLHFVKVLKPIKTQQPLHEMLCMTLKVCVFLFSPLLRIWISYLERICRMASHWRGTVSLHSQNTCCRDSAVHTRQPQVPEALQYAFMEQYISIWFGAFIILLCWSKLLSAQ